MLTVIQDVNTYLSKVGISDGGGPPVGGGKSREKTNKVSTEISQPR